MRSGAGAEIVLMTIAFSDAEGRAGCKIRLF
jgi:hypothetical protein